MCDICVLRIGNHAGSSRLRKREVEKEQREEPVEKTAISREKMGSSAHKHPYRKWSRWSTKIRARRMWCTLEKVYKLRHILAQFCGLWWYMQALYIIYSYFFPKRERCRKKKNVEQYMHVGHGCICLLPRCHAPSTTTKQSWQRANREQK